MSVRPEHPLFILGPTASGKSSLAMELARFLGKAKAAVLCMDAMQIYRGASIGTSKPSLADQQDIVHGGLDLAEVGEPFSVADYLAHASAFLEASHRAGRRVFIVGGTGLYFRALTRGLCLAPEPPADLREKISSLSVAELQKQLQKKDPAIFSRLDINNPRRLSRALEVVEFTGRSLLAWQAETPPPLVPQFRTIFLQRSKEELHARIEKRVHAMLEEGWLEEVKELMANYGSHCVDFPAIGYRQMSEHLETHAGQPLPEEVVRQITLETQHYAKRQLTWFAREPSVTESSMLKDFSSNLSPSQLTFVLGHPAL